MRCKNANWLEEGKDPELSTGHFYSCQDEIIVDGHESDGPYVSLIGNSGHVIQRPKRVFEVATDKEIGLYNKFKVERTDGGSDPGNKHENCKYFVLDLTHDKHITPALAAYAESCKEEFPVLSKDLKKIVEDNEKRK
jgi:hypothetical protein